MSSSRREVFDSDDDSDELSPLSSPLASPQLSPLPLNEDASQLELVELPELPGQPQSLEQPTLPFSTQPADTSTSTDPSFFRDVYEEQQRALGAQPLATANEHGGQAASGAARERDLWEVPSSPVEVVGQQRVSFLKRKRNEEQQRNNASVVGQLEGLGSGDGAGEPTAKQQRTAEDRSLQRQKLGIEISIPLEPLTPSRMRQYPQLFSSSKDNSLDNSLATLPYDESLPQLQAAGAYQEPTYSEVTAAEVVTQSTIAFATPSIYASSGRRALGSSSNNTSSRKSKNGRDMDIIEENAIVAMASTTPPRRARQKADLVQIMSSPDIIAEPTRLPELRRPQSPVSKIQPRSEKDHQSEKDDDWEPHVSHQIKKAVKSAQRPPQRKTSVEDELSISIEIPLQNKAVHEINESDASSDSPPRKAVPKAKSRQTMSKTATISASDDSNNNSDGERVDEMTLPLPVESESDFSDAKPKSKTRSKRGQKKKAAAAESGAEPGRGKPDRSRGRPKKAKQGDEKEKTQIGNFGPDFGVAVGGKQAELGAGTRSGAEAEIEANIKPDTNAGQAQVKGKRGRKAGKVSQASGSAGSANLKVEESPSDIANDVAALGTTSGNASLQNSVKDDGNGEENRQTNSQAKDEQKPEEAEKKQALPSDSKPVPTPAGLSSGLLSTGLNTTGTGRVPYRIGLSKKLRIAPLLKVIRK